MGAQKAVFFKFKQALACLLLFSSLAHASKDSDPEPYVYKNPRSGSYYMLLGLGSGFTRYYSKGAYLGLLNGTTQHFKLVNTGYFRHFIFDWAAGLGFLSLVPGSIRNAPRSSGIIAIGEFAARWRFGQLGAWQFGPLFRMSIGKDPSFAINKPAEQYFLLSTGPQLAYDIPFQEKFLFRIATSLTVDLNVPTRKIMVFMVEGQIGALSQSFSENWTEKDDPKKSKEAYPEPLYDGKDYVKLTLKSSLLRFGPARTSLNNKTKRYLYKIGYFLATHPNQWKYIEVAGHSDNSGYTTANYQLSKERAYAVKSGLVEAGVPSSKIRVVAKGAEEPLAHGTSPSALELNRRVEVIFRGIENEGYFRNEMDKVRRSFE
ncbi:OmpA family protein [bacterium]|nr:OmpA family protein [bacterium]